MAQNLLACKTSILDCHLDLHLVNLSVRWFNSLVKCILTFTYQLFVY